MATVKIREASDASEQEIFQQIAKKLRFPSYFGNNFAALEDCLGDMTEHPRRRRSLPRRPRPKAPGVLGPSAPW